MRLFLLIIVFGLLLSIGKAAITESTVYFDLPENLEPDVIPAPTADLAALPGYPNDPDQLTLVARLFLPDPAVSGEGPYPAVIILHGSGGMWSNDLIANGLLSHLDQWGELLAGMGYIVLFPDSYNPRGIPGNFSNRQPHYNPAIDDAICSPNYERPKDVVAALTYLQGRTDVLTDRIGLMGFSHGAQTAMNAIVDSSVDLGQYTVDYVDLQEVPMSNPVQYQEVDIEKDVDSPVRIPGNLPFPRLCILYYGGGGHYGYHGSPNSTAAGRFMFDRRTKVILFHGTEDFLMDVDDTSVTPMTGNLYPIKQVLASSAQAQAEGVDDPLVAHFLFDLAEHSFDLATIENVEDWNTNAEDADEKAKRLGREESLKWLEACLKPLADLTISHNGPDPEDFQISLAATNTRVQYQWKTGTDLSQTFTDLGNSFDGDGNPSHVAIDITQAPRRFYTLETEGVAPPYADPANTGFFRFYNEFNF